MPWSSSSAPWWSEAADRRRRPEAQRKPVRRAASHEVGGERVGREAVAVAADQVAGRAGGADAQRGEDGRLLADLVPERHAQVRLEIRDAGAAAERGEHAERRLGVRAAMRPLVDAVGGRGRRCDQKEREDHCPLDLNTYGYVTCTVPPPRGAGDTP